MIITEILQQKRRPSRVSIFIDNTFAFGMESTDAERCGLEKGMPITQEHLNNLLNEVIFSRAKDTALRFLSYQPRTLYETIKRLKEDEYPRDIIKRVLILMLEYRYINDRQYAKDYIEERTRAGYGEYKIRQELKKRGIKSETMNNAFLKVNIDEVASIINYIKRNKKIISTAALYRRGFSSSNIKEAFDFLKEQTKHEELTGID